MAKKLIVILKTGEALRYSDAEVTTGSGGYRIAVTRDGARIDSFAPEDVKDVTQWYGDPE